MNKINNQATNKNNNKNKNNLNDVGANESGDQKKLRKLVNQMDINGRNFIILTSEVVNYYLKKDYSHAQIFNKSVESLNLFLDDVRDITDQEKFYLNSQIPNRVNSLLVLRQKKVDEHKSKNKKTKKNKTQPGIRKTKSYLELSKSRSSLVAQDINLFEMDVDTIIDYIYNKLVKMITIKDLSVWDFSNHLLDITEATIKMVNEFSQLNSLEKKRITIRIFNMIADQVDEIFVDLTSDDVNMLKLAIQEIPDLVEVILLMVNSTIEIPPEVSSFFGRLFRLIFFCVKR